MIAELLRVGVLVAGGVVLAGGIYYVVRHGGEIADYQRFVAQTNLDRSAHKILLGAVELRARAVIQLGVLLLIATPILRVALALVAFAMERDRQYVMIAALVLTLLFIGLASGG